VGDEDGTRLPHLRRAAAGAGITTVVGATENHAEAAQVPGITAIGAESLAEVITWLRGGPPPRRQPPHRDGDDGPVPSHRQPDLAEVLGQPQARRSLETCAAGGHHLSLLGPPGAGKTMLAERFPTILPGLDTTAAIEVTSVHSVAGHLAPGTGLITVPPFCAPHHTASMAAIVGGGSGIIRPGAASLAHRGILFLDEAHESTARPPQASLSGAKRLLKASLQVRAGVMELLASWNWWPRAGLWWLRATVRGVLSRAG
jgi:magnesium chelatase family protein